MTDPESSWRVRLGAGLVQFAPLSDQQRQREEREAERERAEAESAAELRRQAAAERLGELRMSGVEPRSTSELFAQVSAGMDRQDRRDALADEKWREQFGLGRPGQASTLLAAAKAEREAREAEEAATPASVANVKKVERWIDGQLTSLKSWLTAETGRKPL